MTEQEKETIIELSKTYNISVSVLISHANSLGLPELVLLLEDTYGSGIDEKN